MSPSGKNQMLTSYSTEHIAVIHDQHVMT